MESIEEKLIELLLDGGISFKENSTGELIFDKCYHCGRAKKLYAEKETGLYKCFRCEEKGNAVKLIAKYLNLSFREAKIKLYGDENKEVDASIEATKKEIEQNLENASGGLILKLGNFRKNSVKNELHLPEPIKLEEDFILLTKETNPDAYSYLINRGYSDEDISKLKLYVLPYNNFFTGKKLLEKKYKNNYDSKTAEEKELIDAKIKRLGQMIGRVVFPLYIEGEIYGYVARDYTKKNPNKVMNSRGNFRSYYFWNFDLVKNSDKIIICEGTTSAVKCGIDRSIALLGKAATEGQLKLFRKLKAKDVYLCLDIGTDKEQKQLIESLNIFYKLYKIELPSHFKLKDRKITDNIVKILKNNNIEYQIYDDFFNISYEDRQFLEKNVMPKTNKMELTIEEKETIFYIAKEAEYLDSGDYTTSEMEEFIKNAKPI